MKNFFGNQQLGLAIHYGARVKGHSGLSSLIFNNESFLEKTAIYQNSGFELRYRGKWLYSVLGNGRTSFSKEISATEKLDVQDLFAHVNLGHQFEIGQIEIVPTIGFAGYTSKIEFTKNTGNTATVSGFFKDAPQTHSVKMEKYFARGGLLLAFQFKENPLAIIPKNIGLQLEYLKGISKSKWEAAGQNSLLGPNLFDTNFSAGITIGWWI